jgi:hypothetical protein
MKLFRIFAVVLGLSLVAGCATLNAVDFTTRRVPREKRKPLPPDCEINVMELEYGDAARMEPQLGVVCIYMPMTTLQPGPYSEKAQKIVQTEACKMGGDMVVSIGDCNGGRGIAFGVFGKPPPAAPTPPAPAAPAPAPAK